MKRGLLVPDPLDQEGRGNRRHEIGDKPHRFDERGLGVIQLKHTAQMRQQRVIDNGDKAPHEEQAGQQSKGPAVIR